MTVKHNILIDADASVIDWRVQPKAFPRFHDWLMEARRTPNEAFAQAARLVGETQIREELQTPNSGRYVSKQIQVYQLLGSGNVPKMLFPESTMTGEVSSVQVLCEPVETDLAIRPNRSAPVAEE